MQYTPLIICIKQIEKEKYYLIITIFCIALELALIWVVAGPDGPHREQGIIVLIAVGAQNKDQSQS